MIEVCTRCSVPTGLVFCPAGHIAKLEHFREEGGAFVEPLYSCTDSKCLHSITAHAGSGKAHLILKHALFNKHLGGKKPGTHRFGCPPTLALRQVVPPRNRRRTDRVVLVDPVQRAAKRIRKIGTESPEVNFLRKLAPVEEIESFLPSVRKWLPTHGAGMRLARKCQGLDDCGCPRPSFIVAVASVIEELENRHQAN